MRKLFKKLHFFPMFICLRIAYAVLYNVSIQFNGHLLMENNQLMETLNDDIKALPDKNINDTIIFALKLLHSLTRNINESMYIILKNEVNSIYNIWTWI